MLPTSLIVSGVLLLVSLSYCDGDGRRPRNRRPLNVASTANGEKLYLTPFILTGKTEEARKLARVSGLPNISHDLEVESYSGFLTVNSEYNSNIFFWFFPALERRETAPLLLWLNGGPGTTSLVGLFNEHGPYVVNEGGILRRRNVTWIKSHSIIYMDSPVGSGFSFTDSEMGYTTTTESVTENLYAAMTQFFNIFPEYRSRDFYVAGQSYAGKYAPSLAHKIHVANTEAGNSAINLKGISVGSGFFDPITQLNYADFYYGVGLIDEKELSYFEEQQERTRDLIEAKNWAQAFVVLESLIVGYPTPFGISYFENTTGISYAINIMQEVEPQENHYFVSYIKQDLARRALHVGDHKFTKFNPKVYNLMSDDIYQSIKPKFVDLLNWGYRVLVYTSQFDGIVPHVTVESFVNSLSWNGSSEFAEAKREQWKSKEDGALAGYKRKGRNFCFAMVRNSGHLVAQDQPTWALELVTDFLWGDKW